MTMPTQKIKPAQPNAQAVAAIHDRYVWFLVTHGLLAQPKAKKSRSVKAVSVKS